MSGRQRRKRETFWSMSYTTVKHAVRAAAALGAMGALATFGWAQAPAPQLFPRPFVVEHGIVETEPDGTTFRTPPVTDYYGGSWIVSVRSDKSRVVIDFGKREITEVRTKEGTYTVVSFARLAELRDRLRRAEQPVTGGPTSRASKTGSALASSARPKPTFVFEELPLIDASAAHPGGPENSAPEHAAGHALRHLRVSVQPEAGAAQTGWAGQVAVTMEAWLDPTVRLEPAALAALSTFERNVIGPGEAAGPANAGELLAAAREHAGGAFPVMTSRSVAKDGSTTHATRIEDVATRLEPVAAFPVELLSVPEGLRRVPHPLETMVAFAESEAARARATRSASGK